MQAKMRDEQQLLAFMGTFSHAIILKYSYKGVRKIFKGNSNTTSKFERLKPIWLCHAETACALLIHSNASDCESR
jgi:hypothetical protein